MPYDESRPGGNGVKKQRYGLLGSVLKINHTRDPLPPRQLGGYKRLAISDSSMSTPSTLRDPDGNEIELVPRGRSGVAQIEIHLGVTDEAAFAGFYGDALQAERIDARRFKLSETSVICARD